MPAILNAKGLLCPLPLIRTQDFARTLVPGAEFTIQATDPGVYHDLPAWCRMHGHEIVSMQETADQIIKIVVRLSDTHS